MKGETDQRAQSLTDLSSHFHVANSIKHTLKFTNTQIPLRSLHTESNIFESVFSYSSSYSIQMHAMDVKMQKIEPDPIFFMKDESFGGSV